MLPRWRTGIEAADLEPAIRDIFLVGFYTGMRRGEILSLRWERVDLDRRILRVAETKTGDITETGGTRFWFHGLRNAFITVAERELMLPRSLTKRLVNHARPSDVTEGYAADWTIPQLREPAQRIADRIDELMKC